MYSTIIDCYPSADAAYLLRRPACLGRKLQYLEQLPKFLQQFIEGVLAASNLQGLVGGPPV
ncbi:hypothetical protein GNZ12_06705 [Paraburkholderia sp. 1N]|uniref:Uncharacterized protein n=1 Tax=Paraburkholderia solitsugae TaxID=2675748 RepID=A0ABX2BLM8_9BURK|nr:hypothetical protein [Paraburkholderia solitsugae]NPT41013.1 hypothetical protein [Paraburkholderia solitsugae]